MNHRKRKRCPSCRDKFKVVSIRRLDTATEGSPGVFEDQKCPGHALVERTSVTLHGRAYRCKACSIAACLTRSKGVGALDGCRPNKGGEETMSKFRPEDFTALSSPSGTVEGSSPAAVHSRRLHRATSSEALGYARARMDMLSFFKNEQHYRFAITRSGASRAMLKWVLVGVFWSRAIRKPCDLGFDDGGFEIPPLIECCEGQTRPPGCCFLCRLIANHCRRNGRAPPPRDARRRLEPAPDALRYAGGGWTY